MVTEDVEQVLRDQLELDEHFTEEASHKVLPALDQTCQATSPVFKLVMVQLSQPHQPQQNHPSVEEPQEDEGIVHQSS